MSSRLTPRSCASASAIALCVVDVTFCANSRGFVNFSHCESVTPAGLANFNAHATDAAPPKILAAASPNSSRAGEVQKVCPDRREPAFIVAFCVRKADLQVGDNCCSRTLVEDIRLGNIKGPGADEVALGLAFTSHGHLVIAIGLRDATSLEPAVRGTHNLGPRGKLLLLDRNGIFLGFIDDAVWFTPPFSVVCDYADRIILQHRDGLAVYELHAAGSPLYPRLLPGSPRLVHFARPPLRELEQIKDEARCREQGGDECVEEGQVFTPAEASSILQLSGPCGVACDDAGHLLILDWER